MDVVAHIGIPKTGSSTIQSVLRRNRAALDRTGVVYRNYSTQLSHAEFFAATHYRAGTRVVDQGIKALLNLRTDDDYARVTRDLDDAVDRDIAANPGARFVISCEMLGWPFRTDAFIAAFCDWLKTKFDGVEIVIYLRAQDSWMLSNYSQQIKNGSAETFDDYMVRQRVPDYADLVARWDAAVGKGTVTVRLFDSERLVDGDLIADFSETLGVRFADVGTTPSRNATLSARGADRMRRLNRIAGRLGQSRAGFTALRVARRALIAVDGPRGGRLSLTPDQRAAIAAQAEPGNDALRAARFAHLPRLFSTLPPVQAAA